MFASWGPKKEKEKKNPHKVKVFTIRFFSPTNRAALLNAWISLDCAKCKFCIFNIILLVMKRLSCSFKSGFSVQILFGL